MRKKVCGRVAENKKSDVVNKCGALYAFGPGFLTLPIHLTSAPSIPGAANFSEAKPALAAKPGWGRQYPTIRPRVGGAHAL